MKPERFYQFLTHVIDLKRITSISDAEVFGLVEYINQLYALNPSADYRDLRFGCLVVFHDLPMNQEYSVEFGKIKLDPIEDKQKEEWYIFRWGIGGESGIRENSRQLKVVKAEVERFREAWKAYHEALDHIPESA